MTEEIRQTGQPDQQGQAEAEKVTPPPADLVGQYVRLLGLATLGAMVMLGESGARFFRTLVEKGERSESQARARVEALGRSVGRAAGRLEQAARKLAVHARSLAGRSEQLLEDGVAAGLRRAGLPTREEIQALMARVEALAERLENVAARLQPEQRSS